MMSVLYESLTKIKDTKNIGKNNTFVFESFFDSYTKYESLFETVNKYPDISNSTSTNNGVQWNFQNNEDKKLALDIKNFIKKKLNYDVDISQRETWAIIYQPGGWQALHYHSVPKARISVVLNFSKKTSTSHSDGALYGIVEKEKGIELFISDYYPGKITIMDGGILHGSYPTMSERKIIVLDFLIDKIS